MQGVEGPRGPPGVRGVPGEGLSGPKVCSKRNGLCATNKERLDKKKVEKSPYCAVSILFASVI